MGLGRSLNMGGLTMFMRALLVLIGLLSLPAAAANPLDAIDMLQFQSAALDGPKAARAQNDIPIAALYGHWAVISDNASGPTVSDPNLVKTDRSYRIRATAAIFWPIYREFFYLASAEALGANGVPELNPTLPTKVIAVYLATVNPAGRLIEYGPVEIFVPISADEIQYVYPGPPQRARKVY